MSLLKHRCKPTLKGAYEVTVKSYREIENDRGGYVEVIFDVPGYGDYTYCIFPTQIDYVTGCLNTQLGVDRDKYALDEALEKLQTIKVIFNYNYDIGRMNVALHDSTLRTPIEEDEVELS